jgi:tetratricopeptide (TPR) repeat protein
VNDVKLHPEAGNIDHILLSPKGIYAIEMKNWSGNIRCYGDQWSKKVGNRVYEVKSVSKQTKRNATDVNKFIREKNQMNLYISPICVFTNPSAKLNLFNQSLPVLQVDELSQYIQNIKPTNSISESDILKISHSLSEDFPRPTVAVQKKDAKMIADRPAETLTSSDSFKKSGDEFFKQGKFNDAIQCYKKAIEINPDFIPAWNNLGFAYFKIGQLDNAKKCKERIKVLKNSKV